MESLCIYGLVIANGIDQRSVHHRYPWHTEGRLHYAKPTVSAASRTGEAENWTDEEYGD